jgi:serine/threonine protein kinase
MARATPITPPPIGAIRIGDRKVQLGAPLGKGALSTVYRATLESAHGVRRAIACKLFTPLSSEDQEPVTDTLRRVVERAACVRHPNVVQTYEYGQVDAQPYVLTELVDGVSLRALIDIVSMRGRRLPLDLALFVATEIAEGLAGARAARGIDGAPLGLTHLDLSAREVLLSVNGEVKVGDFQLAGAKQAASTVRSLAKLARRSDTMSPEVARGQKGDARSDVFSLGILMREILIGPRFPRGISDPDALRFAREGDIQPITFEPLLPDEVREIMKVALELDPQDRFPHAGAMAYELRRVALGLGVGDARVFLRSTLQLETDRDDAPAEPRARRGEGTRVSSAPPPAPLRGFSGLRGRRDKDTD